jgi:hypothetical protein
LSRTSRTARPAAAAAAVPAKVEKYSYSRARLSAISRAGDQSTDGIAGPHRLAEGDEVRRDTRDGEAPEGRAHPPEASLDLIGEEEGARIVSAVDQTCDEVSRGVKDAFASEAEVGQDERSLVTLVRETSGSLGHA